MFFFFFQAEDGIRDVAVTGVQTCALPISEPVRRVWRDAEICRSWPSPSVYARCSSPSIGGPEPLHDNAPDPAALLRRDGCKPIRIFGQRPTPTLCDIRADDRQFD